MTFGKVYISNPFFWRDNFFKDKKIKKKVKGYFVWGGSSKNYLKTKGNISEYRDPLTGKIVKTTGMSGENGPTGGVGHPNYIGIITFMNKYDNIEDIRKKNQEQFKFLFKKIIEGHDVTFPIDNLKIDKKEIPNSEDEKRRIEYRSFIASNHGLGKGISREISFKSGNPQDASNWHEIQSSISNGILTDIFNRLDLYKKVTPFKSKSFKKKKKSGVYKTNKRKQS